MINKIKQTIPANSLGYILICGGIIVIILLLIIFPLNRVNAGRAKDIKKLQEQIDEQKGLGQVYQLAQRDSGKKSNFILSNPVRTKLSRQDTEKFQKSFREEAQKASLMVMSLIPDSDSMGVGSKYLIYNATVKGEFANFRKLLVGVGEMPYVEQIEEMNMKQDSDSMEFRLKIGIALAN
ncbi:MAG: hypothetical protein CVU70_02735 [Deltaproteobacteria bacterium HGW-Deltaproteobacteria-5]|jgi:hypothetical protein|nr:MAG: hypothetical protein CVU70_02735 [Deltaproteobacteria bacterium HGW-Deltaproteobacteria-5]